jgi:hypothetical protein
MSNNPESVLDSIKKVLGFDSTFSDFDIDVIMHTNTFFGSLQQIGVGPKTGFVIADNTLLWSDYSSDMTLLAAVKSYLYIKVRLVFDPPATSFVIDSYAKMAEELEWRLNVMAEEINPPSDPFTGITPTAGTGTIAYVWDITGTGGVFPDDAKIGDLGIDTVTGNLWRND